MAYAPSAIRSAAATITGGVGGAVFSGVVGDAAHSYGYHLARNQLPASDYSVQLAADRDGNGDAASALDISLPPAQMIAVTARLRAAAKAGDPRLYALREFAGTLDGRTTFNRDLSNGGEGFGQWDDSHLWHIHLSGYRRYADDTDAWRAIADVFTDSASIGGGLSEEDDMNEAQAAQLAQANENAFEARRVSGLVLDALGNLTGLSPQQMQENYNRGKVIEAGVSSLLARPVSAGGTGASAADVAKAVVDMLDDSLATEVADLLSKRLAA